jgi:hypothetical protein
MPRPLTSILLSLAAGVLLTILTAWAIALYAPIKKVDISYTSPDLHRSSASTVPPGWEFGCHVTGIGPAIRYDLVTERVWAGSMLGSMSGRQNRSLERVEVGWPFATMEWVGDSDYRMPPRAGGGAARQWIWSAGLEPPIRKGSLYLSANRRLPLTPLWPGFAIHIAAFATACWCAAATLRTLRRAGRRRRGLCPTCRYPRGDSPVCTECGAVSSRGSGVSK